MIDYSKSKIYTIRNKKDTSLIYVGSTTQQLSKRWGEHKKKSTQIPLRPLYRAINDDWDGWYIDLYLLYPCNSREELQQKEWEIIRLIGNLNVRGALNVSAVSNDKIDEKKMEINEQNLEKQREYTRRNRAKQDQDLYRKQAAEWQRKHRARVREEASVSAPAVTPSQ